MEKVLVLGDERYEFIGKDGQAVRVRQLHYAGTATDHDRFRGLVANSARLGWDTPVPDNFPYHAEVEFSIGQIRKDGSCRPTITAVTPIVKEKKP